MLKIISGHKQYLWYLNGEFGSLIERDMELMRGRCKATPHVAGLIAYLIGHNGNTSPATMSSTLKSLAVKGALTGIRESPQIPVTHN